MRNFYNIIALRIFIIGSIYLYNPSLGNGQALDYKYQIMFINNFAKNIEWPPDAQQGDFIIGVFDNQKVAKDMQSFFIGKSINGRKVVIRNFPNINSIQDPHILFIPISNKNVISGITNKLGNKPILIITEKEGWGKQGSVINFIVTEEGRMKFELNKDAAQKRSIKIPSSLANLAIIL